MPPKERNALSANETAALRTWIEAGAPWPSQEEAAKWDVADGITVPNSGGLSEQWTNRRYQPEEIWAFFPVEQPEVPNTNRNGDPHPIDAFIDRKLQQAELEPAPPADKRTWVRRATFNLTGLPPTPQEVQSYLADGSRQAERAVIDRLLASPHYGERMAQHWLDVVRYADTSGFSNDWERPHAWRYRDYVVRAFNDDKPFDRFVKEQVAGDELDPEDPAMKIAVGFLRMGPWEHTSMSVAAVTRQQFLDDVTNSVGLTFLGLEMSCCQCHDHKFDPLPTRDYYRLQAVFAKTSFEEQPVDFLPEENVGFDHLREQVKTIAEAKDWMEVIGKKLASAGRVRGKRGGYMKRAVQRFEPSAFSVKGSGGSVPILIGGSLESPSEEVGPGALSAPQFAGAKESQMRPDQQIRSRLDLAEWIADPRNPLTARVIVNRVWQMHFGTGLVATPNSFGKMGAKPSHPELLDWLAAWFVENGWSIKKLHRLIMTSETYRRDTAHSEMDRIDEADPKNQLLAYFPPRRLSAEELRDARLQMTGELNPERGGPPVFPEINWEVALQPRHIMGGVAPVYQPSPRKSDRHRRSLYAFRARTLSDPMLEVFNKPGPDKSCERRDETTVTPQVFALFNSKATYDRALALADRLIREEPSLEARIERAFELLYSRPATGEEMELARTHFEKMLKHHRATQPRDKVLPVIVDREMVDEQTGLPFRWKEKLHWMLEFEPDIQPSDATPQTRALAELCLVLLNANEFVYVY